ncbi:MAG: hypothetical protein IKZ10_08765, partial [Akkermansia sp.]|nr:hypothetical protein [Akkermansia sp.]
ETKCDRMRAQAMSEEMTKNEEVLAVKQRLKLEQFVDNTRRSNVSRFWVLVWYLTALAALFLWLLKLLGYLP